MTEDIKKITTSSELLVLISDIHFGVRRDDLTWLNDTVQYFENFFIPLIERECSNKSYSICILGDLFDDRDSININTMNVVHDMIERLSKYAPIYILVGNHDMYKKHDSKISSLKLLENIPFVSIVNEPTIINFEHCTTLWLPYTGLHFEETKYITNSKTDFVFMHSEISSGVMSGKQIEVGANVELFKGRHIYSGHIHGRQEHSNFTYIGCPYHLSRSDIGDTKGIYILDTKSKSHTFFANNYSPIYQRLNGIDVLEMPLDEFKRIITNRYTDIILPDFIYTKIDPFKFINLAKGVQYKDLRIESYQTEQGKIISYVQEMIEGTSNIEEVIEKTIDKMNIDETVKEEVRRLDKEYRNRINQDKKCI